MKGSLDAREDAELLGFKCCVVLGVTSKVSKRAGKYSPAARNLNTFCTKLLRPPAKWKARDISPQMACDIYL